MAADVNVVRLYGQIVKKPRLYTARGADAPHAADFLLRTLARYHNSFNPQEKKYDIVTVRTSNPQMIEQIRDLRINNIILLKGMLCTTDVIMDKGACPDCGCRLKYSRLATYVYPLHILIVKEMLSEEEGYKLIDQNDELSNECIISGQVVSDIEFQESVRDLELNRKIPDSAKYMIRVKRPYHVAEDEDERKCDYPMVFTYYEQATTDFNSLHKGSTLNVRGAIRAREVKNTIVCPSCGAEIETEDSVLGIMAYYVGYTHDFVEPPKPEKRVDNLEILSPENSDGGE